MDTLSSEETSEEGRKKYQKPRRIGLLGSYPNPSSSVCGWAGGWHHISEAVPRGWWLSLPLPQYCGHQRNHLGFLSLCLKGTLSEIYVSFRGKRSKKCPGFSCLVPVPPHPHPTCPNPHPWPHWLPFPADYTETVFHCL